MVAALKKKNTIEITAFSLVDGGFSYRGNAYKFDDVILTKMLRIVTEQKVQFVGSAYEHSVSIIIGINSGEMLQVTEQPTWLSDSKLSSVEYVERLFTVICEKSWENRLEKYVTNIRKCGYFEYSGWSFYTSQQKIQDLESNKCYDLHSVKLLTSYGFIEVKELGDGIVAKLIKGLVGRKVGIGTLVDTDVFFSLLKHYFDIGLS